jgi:hypothetical protein
VSHHRGNKESSCVRFEPKVSYGTLGFATLKCNFVLTDKFDFLIKPTRCTNFTNLFWDESLHVSDSSTVHHQEFIHCTLRTCWSYSKAVYKPVKLVHIFGFIKKNCYDARSHERKIDKFKFPFEHSVEFLR